MYGIWNAQDKVYYLSVCGYLKKSSGIQNRPYYYNYTVPNPLFDKWVCLPCVFNIIKEVIFFQW